MPGDLADSGKFDVEQQLDQEDDEDTRVKAYTDRYRRQLESGGKNTGPSTTQPNLMTRQRAALLATATNPSTSSFESSSGSISIASASEKAECSWLLATFVEARTPTSSPRPRRRCSQGNRWCVALSAEAVLDLS